MMIQLTNLFKRKKGMANQIDWAISMAIFLLFIIWFFIVIRQYIPLQARLESQILTIEDKFKENLSFSYTEVPFYITAGKELTDVPVIVNNPVNWTNYTMDNNIYVTTDGTNIFFMTNVTQGTNVFSMKSSDVGYQSQYPTHFFTNISESVLIDSKSFNPRFKDSVLNELYYNSTRYIEQITFSMNDEIITQTTGSSIKKDIFYKAQSLYDWFSVTSYVFPDNSYVTSFFDINEGLQNNATFSITVTMPIMTDYGTDIFTTYSLDLDSGCLSTTSDILDLLDSSVGITFIFDTDVSFEVCDVSNSTNDKMSVEMSFDYDKDSGEQSVPFMIFAHKGSYVETHNDIVSVSDLAVGTAREFIGISKTALDSLSLLSKEELYSRFNISTSKQFEIDVYSSNSTQLFSFSSGTDEASDVFTRSFNDYLVDKNGNKERVLIQIKVW